MMGKRRWVPRWVEQHLEEAMGTKMCLGDQEMMTTKMGVGGAGDDGLTRSRRR